MRSVEPSPGTEPVGGTTVGGTVCRRNVPVGRNDGGRANGSATSDTPLIGRAGELSELARLLGVVEQPSSGVVLLSGDAGVGKTRLLYELRERWPTTAGWRVLVGHCLDLGDSALPYLPFGEAFGRLDGEAPALAAEIAAAQPPVTRLMPARRSPSETTPSDGQRADRTELFEAVHAALRRLGEDALSCLVIEDLHWADRSTRELLSFLFTRQLSGPVSIVASYRSDDLHRRHPFARRQPNGRACQE